MILAPRCKESPDALQEHYLAGQSSRFSFCPSLPPSLCSASSVSILPTCLLMDLLLIPVCLLRSSIPQSDIPTTTHETILFHFPVYNIHVSLLCNSSYFSPLHQLNPDSHNSNSFLPTNFLPKSCSATFLPIPTQPWGNPAHFFSPTFHSLPTTPLSQYKHIVVSLLDASSSTNPTQCSGTDATLQCWLEICCFSSHPIISALVFTLCNQNLEIFCPG